MKDFYKLKEYLYYDETSITCFIIRFIISNGRKHYEKISTNSYFSCCNDTNYLL